MADDYFAKQSKKEKLVKNLQNGDWKLVLEAFDHEENYHEPLLVWIRPSLDMLKFLEKELQVISKYNCLKICLN